MNFYKHHIGDYDTATMHLSGVEDGFYCRLLRRCYATEQPLPDDLPRICILARAHTRQDREAVAKVLHEFFELRDDGWHNRRVDEEVAAARAQADTNRRIAVDRESTKRARSVHEPFTSTSAEREPIQTPDSRLQTPDSREEEKSILGCPKRQPATEPPEFAEIRSAFPLRAGSHRWPEALRHCKARIAEGSTWNILLAGVRRYAAFVAATGKERTEYVLQAATFFGKGAAFAEPWDAPAPKLTGPAKPEKTAEQIAEDRRLAAAGERATRKYIEGTP